MNAVESARRGPFLEAIADVRARDVPLVTLELRRRYRRLPLKLVACLAVGAGLVVAALVLWTYYRWLWYTPTNYAVVAEGTVMVSASLQMMAVALFVPLHGARAVAVEREAKTFEMLAITPLSSASIIVQKQLSILAQVGVVLAGCVAGSVAIIVGVRYPGPLLLLARLEVLIAIGAVLYCQIGLLFSCLCSNPSYAGTLSYVAMLIGLPMLGWLLQFDLSPWGLMYAWLPGTGKPQPGGAVLSSVLTAVAAPLMTAGLYCLSVFVLERRRSS